MTTPTTLSPLLLEIERTLDVGRVMYRGTCVWPLARLAIISCLLWKDSGTIAPVQGGPAQPPIGPFKSNALRLAAQTISRANLARHVPRQLDALLIGWDAQKVEAGTSPPFHRWLSAAHADLTKLGYRTAWIGPGDSIKRPRARSSGCVDIFLPAQSPAARQSEFSGLDIVTEAAKQAGATAAQSDAIRAELLLMAGRVYALKAVFKPMLARMRPKSVYFYCWHSAQNMAVSWVASELGIPSIDIQHGKQGAFNPAYTNWRLVERSPFLPAYFWTWGEESSRRINEDNEPAGRTWHQGLVGGHRDMAAFQSGDVKLTGSGAVTLATYKESGRRIVLVTLQPLDPPVPEAILDAMAGFAPDVQWVVRGPLQKGVKWREQVAARFPVLPASIDIETGNALPLFALLAAADVHVTAFSGTALEALSFGVPTVFTNPFAADVYAKHLAQDHAILCFSGQEVLKNINTIKPVELSETDPYCVTADRIARAAYARCSGARKMD